MRPDTPPEVEAIVARALEKDPALRPAASEVAAELAVVAGSSPSAGWSVGPVRTVVPAEVASTSAVTLTAEHLPARAGETNLPVPVAAGTPVGLRRIRWVVAGLAGVGATAALLVWGFGADREQTHRSAVAFNNEGHDSLAAGNLPAARERFEAARAISPRYAEAKLNLADAFTRAGEVDRAAALYGAVLAENPKRDELLAAAHYGLGELDLQAGAWPSAISHLGEAARKDSARAEYPNNLAFALIQSGRTNEALAVLRAAQARFPAEPALHKNAALAWFAAGEFDSALVAADRSVRLRPTYAAGWLVKLRCEAVRGDRAAARASLEALRRLEPGDAMLAEAVAAVEQAPSGANAVKR
jgi:Tfp pilus assembly protein PilF